MNCYLCNEEIPLYDEIKNNYKVPVSMGFYEATQYEYKPLCITCKTNINKMQDKATYRYIKTIKAKNKLFSLIKEWQQKNKIKNEE